MFTRVAAYIEASNQELLLRRLGVGTHVTETKDATTRLGQYGRGCNGRGDAMVRRRRGRERQWRRGSEVGVGGRGVGRRRA